MELKSVGEVEDEEKRSFSINQKFSPGSGVSADFKGN